jgi:hypothetical protein
MGNFPFLNSRTSSSAPKTALAVSACALAWASRMYTEGIGGWENVGVGIRKKAEDERSEERVSRISRCCGGVGKREGRERM